jgi:very-short-patch-repair endonuclease
MSELEETLAMQMRVAGLPEPEREAMLIPGRRFRCDFAWPEHRLVAECEGGIWSKGRHVTGGGYERDCRKYNRLTLLGWRVLRFTRSMIDDGEAVRMIEEAMT